jgi:hypothetical protein
MSDERFIGLCCLVALVLVMLTVSACDYRKHAFYLQMADKQFCRVKVGDTELWRPCNQANP